MTLQEEIRDVAKEVKELKQFLKVEPSPEQPLIDTKPITDFLYEGIKSIKETIKESISNIKIDIPKITVNNIEEPIDYDIKKFNQNRWVYTVITMLVFGIITLIMYNLNTPLFLLPAGFTVASMGLIFLYFIDLITTFGDSFDKIRKNPISLVILLFIISMFFSVGVFVSKDFIPNSFKSEASFRNDSEQTNPIKETSKTQNTETGYDSSSHKASPDEVEGTGTPNR